MPSMSSTQSPQPTQLPLPSQSPPRPAPARYVQPIAPAIPPLPLRAVNTTGGTATPVVTAAPVQYVAPVATTTRTINTVARVRRTIYTIVGILDIFLGLRLLLRLFAANPDASFSRLIYALTFPFVAPFSGVFPDSQASGSVFEVSTLLALLMYPLFGWIAVRVVRLTSNRQPTPSA